MQLSVSSWLGSMCLLLAATASAQPVLIGRATHPVTDAEANGTVRDPAISGDGRYLYLVTTASNLGPAANGSLNLYRYDLSPATPAPDTLIQAMATLGNGNSFAPSADFGGNRVVFETLAGNLGGNHSPFTDIYLSEAFPLPQGEVGFNTTLVSRGLGGVAPNEQSRYASISADGRFIVFYSDASNLVVGDNNAAPDIFLADADNLAAAPERISVDSNETPISGPSRALSNRAISSDGRYVVFAADAAIAGANPGNLEDVFLRDRVAGTTSLISQCSNGVAFTGSSDQAAISVNARYVAFRSFATNCGGASGGRIFLRDRQTSTTVSLPIPPQAALCEKPRVASDGAVAMACSSALPGVSPQAWFYRGGLFYRLSTSLSNSNGNGNSGNFIDLSPDGNFIVFDSDASDLVSGDSNSVSDAFLTIDQFVLNQLFADGFE